MTCRTFTMLTLIICLIVLLLGCESNETGADPIAPEEQDLLITDTDDDPPMDMDDDSAEDEEDYERMCHRYTRRYSPYATVQDEYGDRSPWCYNHISRRMVSVQRSKELDGGIGATTISPNFLPYNNAKAKQMDNYEEAQRWCINLQLIGFERSCSCGCEARAVLCLNAERTLKRVSPDGSEDLAQDFRLIE